MATTAIRSPAYGAEYPGEHSGLYSWLATTDHKRIGVLYLYTALGFFIFGGIEAVIIRAQLGAPNQHIVSAEFYNQLFTMHGTTMTVVFFKWNARGEDSTAGAQVDWKPSAA